MATLLDAVHKNDAHPREGIVVELAHWRGTELFSGKTLLIERRSFLVHEVWGHLQLFLSCNDSLFMRLECCDTALRIVVVHGVIV